VLLLSSDKIKKLTLLSPLDGANFYTGPLETAPANGRNRVGVAVLPEKDIGASFRDTMFIYPEFEDVKYPEYVCNNTHFS
jgi:hypothetical protein